MASRADLVQVETCDKFMNIEGQDGTAYRNHDGVIEIPKVEAAKVLAAGVPGVKQYAKVYSLGFDVAQAKAEGRW